MKKILLILSLILLINLTGCLSQKVSEKRAKQIALNDALVEEDEVNFTTDRKANNKYYYIFENNNYTYEYIVNLDGTIGKKEILVKQAAPINNYDHIINDKEAINIALNHYNFKEEDINDLVIELDNDDKTIFYNISFNKDNQTYNITIDALNSTQINND